METRSSTSYNPCIEYYYYVVFYYGWDISTGNLLELVQNPGKFQQIISWNFRNHTYYKTLLQNRWSHLLLLWSIYKSYQVYSDMQYSYFLMLLACLNVYAVEWKPDVKSSRRNDRNQTHIQFSTFFCSCTVPNCFTTFHISLYCRWLVHLSNFC